MQKHKSALLLALLFGAAWATTLAAQKSASNWVYLAKIEGPSYWLGNDVLAVSWALPLILVLVFWLQRDKAGRALATVGAVASLVFCLFNVQIALWFRVLRFSLSMTSPTVQTRYSASVWSDFVFVSIAFSLSALCLWLCARAAGSQQPRPIASLRDWKNWSAPHSHRIEGTNA